MTKKTNDGICVRWDNKLQLFVAYKPGDFTEVHADTVFEALTKYRDVVSEIESIEEHNG